MRRVLLLVVALALLALFGCASTGTVSCAWNTSVTFEGERPSEDG